MSETFASCRTVFLIFDEISQISIYLEKDWSNELSSAASKMNRKGFKSSNLKIKKYDKNLKL